MFDGLTINTKTGRALTIHGEPTMGVIIGLNGSGKSQLLRALQGSVPGAWTEYVAPERGGEMNLDTNFSHRLAVLSGSERKEANALNDFRSRSRSRYSAFLTARGAVEDPDHVNTVTPEAIRELAQLSIAGFSLEADGNSPGLRIIRIATGGVVGSVSELSSGEAELLSMSIDLASHCGIAHLADKDQPGIVLLDEPDAHVHPELLMSFARFLAALRERFGVRILTATHSAPFIGALSAVFDKVDLAVMNGSDVTFRVLSEEQAILAEVLGGHPLLGALGSRQLLLVEGIDDFDIFSQAARGANGPKVAVLPCQGDRIVRFRSALTSLTNGLSSASIPTLAILRDGDALPKPGVLRLACRETENLVLAEEVIGPHAGLREKLVEHSDLLEALDRTDINDPQADVKALVHALSARPGILSERWTMKLGRHLGRGRPSGRLAELMGEAVIDTLYQPGATDEP